MRPKKRDKLVREEPKPQFEQIQADHELFLQAFEKPTQIYRYLRTRNLISPIFLQRTLKYHQGRSNRTKNTRENFKVDGLLEQVEDKHKKDLQINSYKNEFMNLTFTGFYNKDLEDTDKVEVELLLLKMCHKRRKDVTSPLTQMCLGKARVPCNPTEYSSPSKSEAIAVASDNFQYLNGHMVRSYMLLIRVACKVRVPLPTEAVSMNNNSLCNGDATEDGQDHMSTETPPKRRRTSRSSTSHTPELSPPREMTGHTPQRYREETMVYGAELVIYDKFRRCMLTEGDYEVALQDLDNKVQAKRQATWETVSDGKVFNRCPTIRFKLTWNKDPLQGLVDSPRPIPLAQDNRHDNRHNNHLKNHLINRELLPKSPAAVDRKNRDVNSPKRRRIFYQFLYNNNTRQQTEARDDLHCPWCLLSCLQLFSLLKHLRTCHARFNFAYVEHPKGARIDVSINDCYDGSYVGNPQDLHSHIGFAFSRTGPVRRIPVTHFIVYKPKKPSFDLSEFMEPESETRSTRQFIQGHNRLYYHTVTAMPIRPQEIDMDSEGDNDPEWLKQKTMNLLDEFTDVNEGEKEITKLWNIHIMHHNFIGDCQMPQACQVFVEEYGILILQQNLVRNYILHLVNLYDFGLIKPEVVYRSMMLLYRLRERLEENQHLAPEPLSADSLSDVHKLRLVLKSQARLLKHLLSTAPRTNNSSSSSSQPTSSSSSTVAAAAAASSHCTLNNGTS